MQGMFTTRATWPCLVERTGGAASGGRWRWRVGAAADQAGSPAPCGFDQALPVATGAIRVSCSRGAAPRGNWAESLVQAAAASGRP